MKNLLSQNNEVLILYSRQEESHRQHFTKATSLRMLQYYFKEHLEQPLVDIHKDKRGKPHLNLPGLNISISHSAKMTVCALSSLNIGVDIEYIRPIDPKCFDLINKLYATYYQVNDLEDWVRFESGLKLKNLRLDSIANKEIITNDVFENIEFQEINLSAQYKSFVCAEQKIGNIKYQYIPLNKI